MKYLWLLALIAATASVQAGQRSLLALVIDDLGYSLDHGMRAIELEGHHTYAILPGTHYGLELARRAHALDKEVILHLPMQSIGAASKREPYALNEAMDENELTAQVHDLLARIPFIRGVNNHMGSHLTEFDFFMRPVMDSIRGYDSRLYFLDSRTSPRSVAYAEAREAGLRSITRDVFLDDDASRESIRLQARIWLERARERGSAIAIGHPLAETLDVMNEFLPQVRDEFRFVRVSELIEIRRQQDVSADRRESPSAWLPGLQRRTSIAAE